VTKSRLNLTRTQILAFRRHVGALDQRLPRGRRSLRRAAWAGLQDSMPRAALLSIRGIGEWTATYIAMRGLRDPDAFPAGDLGLRHTFARAGGGDARALCRRAERWRPWRAYATVHLWQQPPTTTTERRT